MAGYNLKPDGNDLLDGLSEANAWQTSERAGLQGIGSGDTLTFLGTANNPVRGATFVADGTAGLAISGGFYSPSLDVTDGTEFIVSGLFNGNPKNQWLQDWTTSTNAEQWVETIDPGGNTTINEETSAPIFGSSMARFDNGTNASNLTRLQMSSLRLAQLPTRLNFYHRDTGTQAMRFQLRSDNGGGNYLQDNGTFAAGNNQVDFPVSATNNLFTSDPFTPENNTAAGVNGTNLQLWVFASGENNEQSFFQGLYATQTAVWQDQGSGLFRLPYWGADFPGTPLIDPIPDIPPHPTLARSTKAAFAANGRSALVFATPAQLGALGPGEYGYDFDTGGTDGFYLYYQLDVGETFSDLHLEMMPHSQGIQAESDLTCTDLTVWGARQRNIYNVDAAEITTAYDRVTSSHSGIYGFYTGGGNTNVSQDCIYEFCDDSIPEAGSNGHLVFGDGATAANTNDTQRRCISRFNGDDGFQNDNKATLTMESCLSHSNLSEQFTNGKGCVYTITNCTFVSDAHRLPFDNKATPFDDKDDEFSTRVARNNIVVNTRTNSGAGQSSRVVFITDGTNLTESNNLWFDESGNSYTADTPWGVTNGLNTNPLFLDSANNSYKLLIGSLAAGAGDDSVLPLVDVTETPFTSPINMGAYEGVFGAGSPSLNTPYSNVSFILGVAITPVNALFPWSFVDPDSYGAIDLPVGLSINPQGRITGSIKLGGVLGCTITATGFNGTKVSAGINWYELKG